jgi:hypothetical protein
VRERVRSSVKEPAPEPANPVLALHGAGHLAADGPTSYELVLATKNAPTHPGECENGQHKDGSKHDRSR